MVKIPKIVWNPVYSVHVEALDEQHRKLFDIVNRMIDLFESDAGSYLPVIEELVEYLTAHFHLEHIIMMKIGYPRLAEHNREHQKFTEKIAAFLKGHEAKDPELGFNMVLFLKEWVRDHTTMLDVQYGDYLLRHADSRAQLSELVGSPMKPL